jgi:hypothetical protein
MQAAYKRYIHSMRNMGTLLKIWATEAFVYQMESRLMGMDTTL